MKLLSQIKLALVKNFLLKRANIVTTVIEILYPVFIISLLVLIKNVTEIVDSPNASYFCGNTYPWKYANSLKGALNFAPYFCVMRPNECSNGKYYQTKVKIDNPLSDDEIAVYGKIGQYRWLAITIRTWYILNICIYFQVSLTVHSRRGNRITPSIPSR